VTPRYVAADPFEGGKQAVAEAWRNLTAVGADPLAITDCLNFGNPQDPDVMGQIVGAIEGIGAACRALDFPVVSGNVSLYNQTGETPIQPTPAIGGVGLIPDVAGMATLAFKAEDETILLVGGTKGHLGCSLYLRELHGREAGAPPPVDLAAERRNGDFVRGLIREARLSAVHDCADGGALVAIAEMALAGRIGAELTTPFDGPKAHEFWFGEDQGRYLVVAPGPFGEAVLADAAMHGIPCLKIGRTKGAGLTLDHSGPISLAELSQIHESWLPGFMKE
jgi:phosphoribosylformylglycinamidine synthase